MSGSDRPAEDSSLSNSPEPGFIESSDSQVAAESVLPSQGPVGKTLSWLSKKTPWGRGLSRTAVDTSVSPETSGADCQIAPQAAPAEPIESLPPVSEDAARNTLDWFAGLLVKSTDASSVSYMADRTRDARGSDEVVLQLSEGQEFIASPQRSQTGLIKTGAVQLGAAGNAALDAARLGVVTALIKGIRMVSAERDRDEILRWFVSAREILAAGSSTTETAKDLYRSVDTLRFAKLLANTVGTSISNYKGANLPLSLKVALPVTAIGAALFGMKYAGLVALGSGIGLPVILLLFLGTAGATAIIEAFVKDRNIRDPLTKLLLTFVAFETARRAKKELLDAMRADAMVPERAEVPGDSDALLAYLMAMDPVMFERHVMSFFEKDGYPTLGLPKFTNG